MHNLHAPVCTLTCAYCATVDQASEYPHNGANPSSYMYS